VQNTFDEVVKEVKLDTVTGIRVDKFALGAQQAEENEGKCDQEHDAEEESCGQAKEEEESDDDEEEELKEEKEEEHQEEEEEEEEEGGLHQMKKAVRASITSRFDNNSDAAWISRTRRYLIVELDA